MENHVQKVDSYRYEIVGDAFHKLAIIIRNELKVTISITKLITKMYIRVCKTGVSKLKFIELKGKLQFDLY